MQTTKMEPVENVTYTAVVATTRPFYFHAIGEDMQFSEQDLEAMAAQLPAAEVEENFDPRLGVVGHVHAARVENGKLVCDIVLRKSFDDRYAVIGYVEGPEGDISGSYLGVCEEPADKALSPMRRKDG